MKFSIITPVYNAEHWIAHTIESVLSQTGDFFLEYIIVDDNSTDSSRAIVEKYIRSIIDKTYPIKCSGITMRYICRTNKTGMYSAINDGFSVSSGDYLAWINADDIYEQGAFAKIALVFKTFPEIQWLKGITSTIDEHGYPLKEGVCTIYRQDWLLKGIYGQEAYYVEQDSVFWRRELWQKTGPIPETLRYAGDYWLWIAFAKHAPLISLNTPISRFRKRSGQLSRDIRAYKGEQRIIRPHRSMSAWVCRIFFNIQFRTVSIFPSLQKMFIFLYAYLFIHRDNSYVTLSHGTPSMAKAASYVV